MVWQAGKHERAISNGKYLSAVLFAPAYHSHSHHIQQFFKHSAKKQEGERR